RRAARYGRRRRSSPSCPASGIPDRTARPRSPRRDRADQLGRACAYLDRAAAAPMPPARAIPWDGTPVAWLASARRGRGHRPALLHALDEHRLGAFDLAEAELLEILGVRAIDGLEHGGTIDADRVGHHLGRP